MQDFHSIPGLAGRIFGSGSGGGGGGADHRRLRGYPGGGGGGGQEPPAKCPRCESTNTKFCYYNNYNLSQPRHFCKSCRRYWTKGGVLRNVPVGGGCRKSSSSKRSSSKKPSKDRRRTPAASRSSSDSSSLTAATTDASASASASYPDPTLFAPSNPNPSPGFDPVGAEPPPLVPGPEIFSEAGSFTSLMAAATVGPAFFGLNFPDPPLPLRLPLQQKVGPVAEEIRMPGLTAGLIDQTVLVDLPPMQLGRMGGEGGISGLDWPGAVDPALFDLTSAVDPGAYWNQGHWGDADPSLYLP